MLLLGSGEFFSAGDVVRWLLSPISVLAFLGNPFTPVWFGLVLVFVLTVIAWLAGLHSLLGVGARKRVLATNAEHIDEPANPTVERYARLFKLVTKLCLAYLGASLIATLCLAAVTEAHAKRPLSLLIIFPALPYLTFESLIGGGALLQEYIYFWISFVVSLIALLRVLLGSRRRIG